MATKLKLEQNERLPLRDVVFQTLRQAILRGVLTPGERLMEIKLANQLGVSRTPIREAIRMLQLEGLVLMVPRKGAEVAEISEQNLTDVLEVRTALEELSISLACDRMDEADFKALENAAAEFKAALVRDDLMEIAEADVAFHDVIYTASRNQKLIQLLSNFREQMYRFRIEYLKKSDIYPELVEEHQEIIRHLRERNKERATKIIISHIDNQAKGVRKQLQEKKNNKK